MPTLDSVLETLDRIEIVVPPQADARKVFCDIASVYDNRKVEMTKDRHIIIMAPAGIDGAYLSGDAFRQLANWAKQDGTGKAFDSSAGFYITETENRSPDAAWVRNHRLNSIPKAERKTFAPWAPDFAIEVKSPSRQLGELQEKCRSYVMHGALEAWLINPENKTVEVYRSGEPPITLTAVSSVRASGPLAGFVLDLTDIWSGL